MSRKKRKTSEDLKNCFFTFEKIILRKLKQRLKNRIQNGAVCLRKRKKIWKQNKIF